MSRTLIAGLATPKGTTAPPLPFLRSGRRQPAGQPRPFLPRRGAALASGAVSDIRRRRDHRAVVRHGDPGREGAHRGAFEQGDEGEAETELRLQPLVDGGEGKRVAAEVEEVVVA